MQVGVPKEIKAQEFRVGMTPAGVRELVSAGHTVLTESRAGDAIGLTDDLYRSAGASVVETAEQVFAESDMVVKVKEPQPHECRQLRPGQLLFTYLHLAANPPSNHMPERGGERVIGPCPLEPPLLPSTRAAPRRALREGTR